MKGTGAATPLEPDTEIEVDVDIDPVCGEIVEPEEAAARGLAVDYEGRRYVFCGHGCRGRFEHAPTQFAAAGRTAP
jgi:YHS domain-containing protein